MSFKRKLLPLMPLILMVQPVSAESGQKMHTPTPKEVANCVTFYMSLYSEQFSPQVKIKKNGKGRDITLSRYLSLDPDQSIVSVTRIITDKNQKPEISATVIFQGESVVEFKGHYGEKPTVDVRMTPSSQEYLHSIGADTFVIDMARRHYDTMVTHTEMCSTPRPKEPVTTPLRPMPFGN